MIIKKFYIFILILLLTLELGCSTPDSFIKTLKIQNSNKKIKVGMSKTAVKSILGKPTQVEEVHTTSLYNQNSYQEEWFYCSDDICEEILFTLHFWNNNLRIIEKHNNSIKKKTQKLE